MNRSDLIRALADKASLSRSDARRVIHVLFGTAPGEGLIADSLDAGDRVTISGFGTFTARDYAARRVRDPRSGERRDLPAFRRAAFRPGIALRERLRLR